MDNDSEQTSTGDDWEPALERFEELLTSGKPPDIKACLENFKGDQVRLVAELVAIYQSYCELHRPEAASWFADILNANPEQKHLISQAVGLLSTQHGSGDTTRPDTAPDLPRKLGHYLLVERLGRGGFSEVYLGCSAVTAEFVVLKVARDDISRADLAAEALRQEKSVLQQLRNSPGFSRFIDWHETAGGPPALITAFDQGRPLDRLRLASSPALTRMLRWMIKLCDILQEAHSKGVHHCDLKPHNVLIAERDDTPILIDFGLAQSLIRWSREAPGPAPPVGTLHYLAPELLQGGSRAEPRLVDMFGLGGILYFLLTGVAPFEAASEKQARDRVSRCDIDPLPLNQARIPNDLKEVCRKALAKKPSDRYQTPHALGEALAATAVGRRAVQPSRLGRFAKVAIPLSLLALLTLAVILYRPFSRRTQENSSRSDVETIEADPATKADTKAVEEHPPISAFVSAADERIPDLAEGPAPPATGQADATATPEPQVPQRESWLRRIAALNNVSLSAIGPNDFSIEARSVRNEQRPWAQHAHDPHRRGEIVVKCDPKLDVFARALQFRVGTPEWQQLERGDRSGHYVSNLGHEQLLGTHPLEIRLAVDDPRDDGTVVGPFRLDVDVPGLAKAHAEQVTNALVAQAIDEPCFDATQLWSISGRYASRYGPVIRYFRVGSSITAPMIEIHNTEFWNGETGESLLPSLFADRASALLNAEALWVEIEFVNGRYSGPKRTWKRLPTFGSAAEDARKKLATLPAKDMAAFSHANFVLGEFNQIASDLDIIELGPTEAEMRITLPVVAESTLPDYAPKRSIFTPVTFWPHEGIHGVKPHVIPGAYSKNGFPLGPISVPPIWNTLFYRGRFKDGTLTPTYFVINLAPKIGFPLRHIRSSPGCPPTPAYAFLEWSDQSRANESVFRHIPIPPSASREQMDVLHRVRLAVFAELPNGAVWFEHLGDETASKPPTFGPGLHYTAFLDRYGRFFGRAEYRIDKEDFRRAVIALVQQAEKEGRIPNTPSMSAALLSAGD